MADASAVADRLTRILAAGAAKDLTAYMDEINALLDVDDDEDFARFLYGVVASVASLCRELLTRMGADLTDGMWVLEQKPGSEVDQKYRDAGRLLATVMNGDTETSVALWHSICTGPPDQAIPRALDALFAVLDVGSTVTREFCEHMQERQDG